MADTLTCDVAVIGAGTAGLAAARTALDAGAKVLLIDEAFAGTVCANVGCMPSKLLIAAASTAHTVDNAATFGVRVGEVTIDGPAVMDRVRRERDKFVAATIKSFDDFPEGTCIKARARFTSPDTIALDDGRTVRAKSIVIATGAKPIVPKPFKDLGDLVLTHETVFEMADLPETLAVIGGGPIGLELAQAFARLGVKTALFDQEDTLGGVTDEDVQAELQSIVSEDVTLHLGANITPRRENGRAVLEWNGKQASFDKVLMATGRPPQLDGLDLEAANIELDDEGTPVFDRHTLQCGDSAIFIVGDANADVPILHEASSEGTIAGANAARYPSIERAHRKLAFSVVFTEPPVAVLGDPPGADTIVGHASYADQGRAKVEARNRGVVRLYAEPEHGRLTGASLIAPGADHMAHWLVAAIAAKMTATEMLALPFYHPTLEEGLKPALREICAAIPSAGNYDRTTPPGA